MAPAQGIGAAVRRVEDERLLRGAGRFVADIVLPAGLHAVFVRSPHAHARILSFDVSSARAAAGVVAVFSRRGYGGGPYRPDARAMGDPKRDGEPMAEPPRWALARDRVRHVGEPVALVIAETSRSSARCRPISFASTMRSCQPSSTCVAAATAVRRCFTTRLRRMFASTGRAATRPPCRRVQRRGACVRGWILINNRLIGAAIEPRAVLAVGRRGEKLTLYSSTQVPHHIRRYVAEQLRMPEGSVRVVAPDVGGGFGYKGKHYPEETAIAWAAKRLRRPVKWVASRSESFVADNQGRDHLTRPSSRSTEMGDFLALRVETIANIGAYVSTFGAAIPSAIYSALLAGVYRTPAISVKVTGVFTNTLPTDAYRGAGRPEACYVLERLADRAAAELGIDRADIRRRNLIPLAAMPYKTPIGPTYDCGDFPKIFARVLEMAAYASFEQRRAAARRDGQVARHRHGLLCRILWRRALAFCRCAWGADRVF